MYNKIHRVISKWESDTDSHFKLIKILSNRPTQRFIMFLIIGSIAAIIISSFKEVSIGIKLSLFAFTYLASILFLLEYVIRIIAAPTLYPLLSRKKARIKYLFSFFGLVDFVAFLPFLLTYLYWDTVWINLIILAHIFIIFKLIRYSKAFHIIGKALWNAREELIAAYTICGIMICFSAILMYYIENKAQPEAFSNIGDGFWWAIITFTTVGYGDIYPVTVLGKILGGTISLIGIGMIALPTGIISSAFMSVIQQKKQKENN